MYGWHRRVPRGLALIEPVEELVRCETRRAHHARPGGERRDNGCHQTMNVEQRHDVQTAITRGELQRHYDVAAGAADVGLSQRHHLGSRGGAGRVQQQRNVVGLAKAAGRRLGCRPSGQHERSGLVFGVRDELDDRNISAIGHLAGRRGHTGGDDQRFGVEVRQVEVELGEPVRRIQRGARGTRRHAEERDRHLGTVRQHDCDRIGLPDPERAERRHRFLDLLHQPRIREGAATRRADCGRVRRLPSGSLDHVVERLELERLMKFVARAGDRRIHIDIGNTHDHTSATLSKRPRVKSTLRLQPT